MPEADAPPSPEPPAPPRPCCGDLDTIAGLMTALASLGYGQPLLGKRLAAFQAHDGDLAVDGVPGPLTKAALIKALAALA